MKMVSQHIGFDGDSYYCLHCGRSNYETMYQARGHLAQCPKRALKSRVLHVNDTVKELAGDFVDNQGIKYAFSLRYWPVSRGG